MTIDAFSRAAKPDPAWPAPLRGLWRDVHDDWDGAHAEVQSDESADGAWVHAYLHRKEGDLGNARYWYARAGRPASSVSLAEEWREIAGEMLGGKTKNE
ncbi:MAG TPA: hypothetical protein VHD32_05810 [Candidatus Didemnitutus sp.]|nr:hypothetical protein [Candidatus Didemnitutus sp.]